MAKVAVIITVLNEEGTIEELIVSLTHQTHKADEIIIVDGGSTDNTWKLLQKREAVKAYKHPGNRSVGRNFGVNKSKSQIIAFTDAGCLPGETWLEELIKPFADSQTQIVSGYYTGLASNVFEECLVPYVLVMPDRIKGEFFPASRSMALRRSVWDRSGGFNERLWHNEDYEFAHRLKKLGYGFVFAQNAIVGWQPRKDLRQAAWMFLRFAIGDIQAGIWRNKVKLLALRCYLFVFGVFLSPWVWLLIIPYLIWAVAKNYKYVNDVRAIFWLPVLQLTSDIMVLFGTVVGLLTRV